MNRKYLKPGWKMVKFGDVVRKVNDRVVREETGLEYYLGGQHFNKAEIHVNGRGVISENPIGPAFHMRFKPGHMLLVSRNPHLRKASIAEFEGICANTTYICDADRKSLLPELLPFLMQTDAFWTHAEANKRGSTNPYLNWADFARFEFPLPPIKEQKRIAEILWAADEAKESWMQALNCFEIAINKKFEVMMKTEAGMKELHLEDCCHFITDGDHNPPKRQPSGIPHVVVKHILEDGSINISDCTYIHPSDFLKVQKRYDPIPNDLILTCVGTVGRTAIVPKGFVFSADRSLALLRFRKDVVRVKFAKLLLISKRMQRKIESRSIGTAQKHLYLKDIRGLHVSIPPLKVQDKIIQAMEVASKARASISINAQAIAAVSKGFAFSTLEDTSNV